MLLTFLLILCASDFSVHLQITQLSEVLCSGWVYSIRDGLEEEECGALVDDFVE